MKAFILFREGLSGHYLKSVLTGELTSGKFRMDPWFPGIYDTIRPADSSYIKCGHAINRESFDVVLTILVRNKVYQAAYNVFYKKMLLEQFTQEEYANWKDKLSFWYDKSFYNIKEYYEIFRKDLANNQLPNVVEFDRLLDEDYVESISQQYFGKTLDAHSRQLIREYAKHQLDIELTLEGSSMEEILDPIPDSKFQESPWFASYAIFKFEENNGLSETQRLWSIDNISQPIDRQYLLDISKKYS